MNWVSSSFFLLRGFICHQNKKMSPTTMSPKYLFSIEGYQAGNYDFRCDSFQWMHSIYGAHVHGFSRNG